MEFEAKMAEAGKPLGPDPHVIVSVDAIDSLELQLSDSVGKQFQAGKFKSFRREGDAIFAVFECEEGIMLRVGDSYDLQVQVSATSVPPAGNGER